MWTPVCRTEIQSAPGNYGMSPGGNRFWQSNQPISEDADDYMELKAQVRAEDCCDSSKNSCCSPLTAPLRPRTVVPRQDGRTSWVITQSCWFRAYAPAGASAFRFWRSHS